MDMEMEMDFEDEGDDDDNSYGDNAGMDLDEMTKESSKEIEFLDENKQKEIK